MLVILILNVHVHCCADDPAGASAVASLPSSVYAVQPAVSITSVQQALLRPVGIATTVSYTVRVSRSG